MLTLLFTSQKTVDYHSSIFQSMAWVSLSHLYVTYVSWEKYSSGNSLRKASDSPYFLALFSNFELQYIKQFSPFDEKPWTGFF